MTAQQPGASIVQRAPRGAMAARVIAAALPVLVIAGVSLAQPKPPSPSIPADLQAALAKADAGRPEELVRLADAGRPDAQTYAAVLYLFGRGGVPRSPSRGCAYAEKAAAVSGEAAFLSGECYRQGLAGAPDPAKAKAAYGRASSLGFTKAKCALGLILMREASEAARGLALCKEAAEGGDATALVAVADAYFSGRSVVQDHAEARKWYQRAAEMKNAQAARRLGEMYAAGDGGRRDEKKALELWRQAEAAGDPLACILVADQLFAQITGGKKPSPGTYAFKGGVPVGEIEGIEDWYRQALERDPRSDVKARAKYALGVLDRFKMAREASATAK